MPDVFITKYALTGGITRKPLLKEEPDRYVTVSAPGAWNNYELFHRGEWFSSEAEALADAEQRRVKKIAALKKQIAKLEKMTFTIPGADAMLAARTQESSK